MGNSIHEDEDMSEFQDEPWRSHPATEKQKKKLSFFGVRINPQLTKGEASDLIQAAMDEHPEIDAAYEAAKETAEEAAEDLEMLEWMLNDEDVRDVCHYKKLAKAQIRQMHEYFMHHVPDWKQKSRFELGDFVARVLPS